MNYFIIFNMYLLNIILKINYVYIIRIIFNYLKIILYLFIMYRVLRSFYNKSNVTPILINRKNFYNTPENINNYHESLYDFTVLFIISSVLWGFESYNKKNKTISLCNQSIDTMYFDCLKYNNKLSCDYFRQYLHHIFTNSPVIHPINFNNKDKFSIIFTKI